MKRFLEPLRIRGIEPPLLSEGLPIAVDTLQSLGMNEMCSRCGHPSGPHIMAATVFVELKYPDGPKEIPAGGHMYCPAPGCACHGTWSIPDEVAGIDVKQRIAEQGDLDPEAVRKLRGH